MTRLLLVVPGTGPGKRTQATAAGYTDDAFQGENDGILGAFGLDRREVTVKNRGLLFVAAVLFIGATSSVSAQSNVAHVDTGALVEAMPEMKAAQGQLEKLQQTYDAEINSMMKEWETKVKRYDGESATQTEEVNLRRVEEVQGMQKNIGDYRNQALEDLRKKEVDLLQPILEKAKAAIQKVARAKGFQYVLDASPGNGLILSDGPDLLADVKRELGI